MWAVIRQFQQTDTLGRGFFLRDEMEEIVDESPAFLVSKVTSVRHGLEKFTGEYAALEEKVWKLVYAGRREKSRVLQVLARRRAL